MNDASKMSELFSSNMASENQLADYVQSMSPETVMQLSKPSSGEVFQLMERNIISMLGGLPSEHFGVTVTTSREQLGRLLASAMMSGYFLHGAEQRMQFERSLMTANLDSDEDSQDADA